MALSSIKRDLDLLVDLIAKMTESTEDIPHDARIQVHIPRVLQIVHQKRPLQKLYDISVPWETSLTTFFIDRLSMLDNMLSRRDLSSFDTDFFLAIFEWIDYLLPIGREREVRRLDAAGRLPEDYILGYVETALYALLEIFQFLPHKRLREIFLAPDQRLTAVLARAWLKWPSLCRLVPTLPPRVIEACVLGFPLLHKRLKDRDLQEKARDVILPGVAYSPRRFYRRFARHIRATMVPQEPDGESFVQNHLSSIISFTHAPGFERIPRELVVALMDCLRHPNHLVPPHWYSVWAVLAPLCIPNPRTARTAVKHGLFECLVRVRLTDPATLMLPEMTKALRMTIVSPRVVRGFQTSFSHLQNNRGVFPPFDAFDEEEDSTENSFTFCFNRWDDAEFTWAKEATCCNAACPNEGGDIETLRACICGEALYCSKTCQRAHWVEGNHRRECPTSLNPEKSGTHALHPSIWIVKARDMYNIVALAARTFGDSYDQITEVPGQNAIKIDLRSLLEGREVMIHIVPETGEGKKRAMEAAQPLWHNVEVYFMHEGQTRTRLMQFVHEEHAGRFRMPFRLLTQAYTSGKVLKKTLFLRRKSKKALWPKRPSFDS
uniref:MYND-type domain-containing protein n=1 Tax=Schizophyllum commune (strain H4-8 / FGSC 9210) TaxID=578458 RepID=D8Q103_SCHCM